MILMYDFLFVKSFLQSSTIRATTWIVNSKMNIPSLLVLIANMEIKRHICPLFIFISGNFWLLMPLKPGVVFSVVSPRLLLQFFCSQILLICILHTMIGFIKRKKQKIHNNETTEDVPSPVDSKKQRTRCRCRHYPCLTVPRMRDYLPSVPELEDS